METINDRFKQLRKACHKTQEEWGRILGITRTGVAEIESGRRNVNEKHLVMLSNWQEHKVNIEWLRTGEGGDENKFIKATPYQKAYNRFGYIMENSTPAKKATLSMLLELLYEVPDDVWDSIMNEFNEMKKED